MLGTLGNVLQALSIVAAASFALWGMISRAQPLTRADKIAIVGTCTGAIFALTILGINMVQGAQAAARQQKMATDVNRNLHRISSWDASVDYDVAFETPELAASVAQWKRYMAAARPQQFDDMGYSKSDPGVLAHIDGGKIDRLSIDPGSPLFPPPHSHAFQILFPNLQLEFLRKNDAPAPTIIDELAPIGNSRPDLSLFLPLSLVRYHQREPALPQDKKMAAVFARITFDPASKKISVFGSVTGATSRRDDGAIVSLNDLPDRQAALAGLDSNYVTKVSDVTLSANVGLERDWSGTKQFLLPDLTSSTKGNRLLVSFRLKRSDFSGLEASSAENK